MSTFPGFKDFGLIRLTDLVAYRFNEYSQFGEDGILHKLITDLFGTDYHGLCVECGAWDGVVHSNTRALYSKGWASFQIEGDPAKFDALKTAVAPFPEVVAVNKMIEPTGANSLDALLTSYNVPELDLMVLDVDGDEYYIFEQMAAYHPSIMMVEVNGTFPFNVEYIQNPGERVGSSALAMCRLAARKGYKLVCYNAINCIFLDRKLYSNVHYRHTTYMNLIALGMTESLCLSKDYDGNHFIYGPWDMSEVTIKRISQLVDRANLFSCHSGMEFMGILEEIDG